MSDPTLEHAEFIVDGVTIEVVEVDGHEGVSELFEFVVQGGMPAGVADAGEWPGADCTLTLRDTFDGIRVIQGVVGESHSFVHDDGTVIVKVFMRPQAHLLTLGRDCRYFLNKSVRDIVSEVLGEVPHRWELSESYRVREYTVQYREDDYTFISRLLDNEGIYYWFDHAAGTELVLTDDAAAAPDVIGNPLIRFEYESGMFAHVEVVNELGSYAEMAPTKFTVGSFDPLKPRLKVDGFVGDGHLEYYDAPGGGPPAPDECLRQATIGHQASRALAEGYSGETTTARLTPGRVFEVFNHPLDGFNKRFFLREVDTRIVQRRRGSETSQERPFTTNFIAMEAGRPYRAPRDAPAAKQAGLQMGVVWGPEGEEIHPNEHGLVRVRLHWDRTEGPGWWMRVAQRGTDGSLQLPRVGWNVLTFNEEGAADAPSVLARILDAEHPPPYKLPENKTRVVFKTGTSPIDGSHNEIYFEDTKGAEQMFIHASRDMNVLVQRTRSEKVQHDHTRSVGNDHTLTVGASRDVKVIGNQATEIGSNELIETGGENNESVDQNYSISIGGNRSVKTGMSHSITVEQDRTLSVGAALIDVSLGDISGDSDVQLVLTGGAQINLAAQSVSQQTGGIGLWAVGGLKGRFSTSDHEVDCSDTMVETVGGMMVMKSKAKFVDTAVETSSWAAGVSIQCDAPVVMIKALSKLELVCGGSTITLYPDRIEGSSPNLNLSQSSGVKIETATIHHN